MHECTIDEVLWLLIGRSGNAPAESDKATFCGNSQVILTMGGGVCIPSAVAMATTSTMVPPFGIR